MSKMNTTQQSGLVESQPGLQLLTEAEASALKGGFLFLVAPFVVGWKIGTYINDKFIAPKP